MHSGSCLCNAVQYQISSPLTSATHCHCSQCRKGHGAAFASYASALRENFNITAGQDFIVRYEPSPGVTRSFCQRCGATLLWESDNERPEWLAIALGTLDTPLGIIPQKHIYTDDKADWYHIADNLPREGRS
ncbi:GFA family protein [Ectopseudomonas mendocina]|uniref:GFA family protein n=1 Tax=Ectopseudomonas mendocina TaxID=300 RepID=A0ABZ2RU77_ECTME